MPAQALPVTQLIGRILCNEWRARPHAARRAPRLALAKEFIDARQLEKGGSDRPRHGARRAAVAQLLGDRPARSQAADPYEDLQLLSAVFGKIKSDYVEPVSDEKLIKEAINGMVPGLDPHSDFLDADAFKELQVSTQGKFGGLGIEVGVEDGVVRVISPIEDTPAFRAGIKSGDLIVKIDDIATRGMPLSKAVEKMRGKPGHRGRAHDRAQGRRRAVRRSR